MRRLRDMNEWSIQRIFGRTTPATDDPLDDIQWFVRDAQRAYPTPTVDEATAAAHVSAMLEATRLSADNGDPVARPVSKAHGPAPQVSGLPKLRRKPVLSNLFATLAAKIAAGSVATITGVSGMAVAGVLPDPAQSAAAKVASTIGLDIEDPDDDEIVPHDPDVFGKTEDDELGEVNEDADLDDDGTTGDEVTADEVTADEATGGDDTTGPTADDVSEASVASATEDSVSAASVATVDEPSADEPSADEASLDEPSVDEASIDEPTVDEPSAETAETSDN